MKPFVFLLLFLGVSAASAHSWTPTYFEFRPSHLAGVYVTEMTLFNKREDAKYYSVEVRDKDFNSVSFRTTSPFYVVEYLEKRKIDVYVAQKDLDKALYICSRSRFPAGTKASSLVSSRVCSKVRP